METLKRALRWLVNVYNTNAKVHSLVVAIEQGIGVGVGAALAGGLPLSKTAWAAAGGALAGAIYGAIKRWVVQNFATQPVPLKTP